MSLRLTYFLTATLSLNALAQQPVLQSSQIGSVPTGTKELVVTTPNIPIQSSAKDLKSVKPEELENADVVLVGKTAPEGVDINYLPFFGGYIKSEEQQKEESLFLEDCRKNFTNDQEASNFFAQSAWVYLSEGSKDLATHRFNLAWLLNKDNLEVFWGLGVLAFQKEDYHSSIELLGKVQEKQTTKDATLLVDLATVYLKCYAQHGEQKEIDQAMLLLNDALELNPKSITALMQKVVAFMEVQDNSSAWETFHTAYSIDAEEVSIEVLERLLKISPDPKGVFKQP